MSVVVSDSMTGTNWHNLTSRSGEIGATWTTHPTLPGLWRFFNNKIYCEVPGAVYASGVPDDADYTVECDYTVFSDVAAISIAGRMSTSASTMYYTYYNSGELVLAKMVTGVITSLDTAAGVMSAGNTYRLSLEMVADAIKVYVNGVERCSVTDSSITAVGRGGVRSPASNDAGVGKHIDNFLVFDTTAALSTRVMFAGFIG